MINKKFVNPTLMWLIVLLGAAVIFYLAPNEMLMKENTIIYLLVISAVLYWMYFFSLAVYVNRLAHLGAAKTEKLIKNGVYSAVRHPIYAADIVLAWGIFLFWPTLKVLASVIWLAAVLFYWMRLEEQVLMEKFGDEYLEYKKQVPMFFPRMFKK